MLVDWLYACSLQSYDIFGASMGQMVWLFHEGSCSQGGVLFFAISFEIESFVLIFLILR